MNLLSFNRNRIGGTLHFVAGKGYSRTPKVEVWAKRVRTRAALSVSSQKDRQGKGGAGFFHVDGSHVGVKSPVLRHASMANAASSPVISSIWRVRCHKLRTFSPFLPKGTEYIGHRIDLVAESIANGFCGHDGKGTKVLNEMLQDGCSCRCA